VTANIQLLGWFASAGLRATEKQPDSRGVPGISSGHFLGYHLAQVTSVAWYHCQMEFLGGTITFSSSRFGKLM